METLLAPWKTHCKSMDNENWFEDEFEQALYDLDPKASVGLSYLTRQGSDIGTALGWDPMLRSYNPSRVAMFKAAVRDRLANPEQADPILVFVKPEPHKRAKLEQGRLRLISAVSVVDTMTDRVMFGWLQRVVLKTVGMTPVMVGWSPYRGGYLDLTARYHGLDALCIDKSSWDWTVKGWLLIMSLDVIRRMAVDAPAWWHDWLDRRWTMLFRDAVYGFKTGERIKQPGWGVMKSGCYLTIVLNSLCQTILHAIVSRKMNMDPEWTLFRCMGDDTIQKPVADLETYVEKLRELGAIVKDHCQGPMIEFCGHNMVGLYLRPVYTSKHIFKLMFADPAVLPQMLLAYHLVYAMDQPIWEWMRLELGKLAPSMVRNQMECLNYMRG